MSIGFLKRLLALAKLVAVLTIVGAAYGYWDHHRDINGRWDAPDFRPPVVSIRGNVPRIDDVGMQLGRFQREVEAGPAPEAEKSDEDIVAVLDRLGSVTNAFVAYPPYEGLLPTIIFEFKQTPAGAKSNVRTIALGEALEERPHHNERLREAGYTLPYRYKFVGCEPDPEHEGWTYFLFDMHCDGTDIQKARWWLETEEKVKLPTVAGGNATGLQPTVGKGFAVLDEKTKEAASRPPEPAAPTPEEPPAPQPVAPPPPSTTEFAGTLFEEEGGAFAPTAEGVRYLKENYQKMLKDTVTQTYVDRETGRAKGIRVVRLRAMSKANEFGIFEDDVILSINDIPVTKQSQAVNVVKRELNKKPAVRYLTVKILRHGRTISKRFDTRDPETRAKARRAFR
ncbi:MAG: hypothetical protein ACYTEZ_18215 [Planctomycetota bacterium]|jgi:hypothetical protein